MKHMCTRKKTKNKMGLGSKHILQKSYFMGKTWILLPTWRNSFLWFAVTSKSCIPGCNLVFPSRPCLKCPETAQHVLLLQVPSNRTQKVQKLSPSQASKAGIGWKVSTSPSPGPHNCFLKQPGCREMEDEGGWRRMTVTARQGDHVKWRTECLFL